MLRAAASNNPEHSAALKVFPVGFVRAEMLADDFGTAINMVAPDGANGRREGLPDDRLAKLWDHRRDNFRSRGAAAPGC
jgi:hypothetical protein